MGAFAKWSLFNCGIVIKTNAADRYGDDIRTADATGVIDILITSLLLFQKGFIWGRLLNELASSILLAFILPGSACLQACSKIGQQLF